MLNWASSQATSVLCSAVVCWWKGIASSQLQRPAEMTCVEAVCRSGSAYNGDDVLYSLPPTRSSAALGKSWGCSSFLGHGRFSLQKERERERERESRKKKNRIVCKLENWKFRTNWYTLVNIKTSFKGALSRYSVIFCAILLWGKIMAAVHHSKRSALNKCPARVDYRSVHCTV